MLAKTHTPTHIQTDVYPSLKGINYFINCNILEL